MPKLCEFETCRVRATYGLNCDPIRCFEHKENSMKLSCILCKCGKIPNFNFEGLKPKFCVSCKTLGMIDVKIPKCFCGKSQPIYNFEGLKRKYCLECMENDMINLVSKKCLCKKSQPTYNYDGLKQEYCKQCKVTGMIDVANKKCIKCKEKDQTIIL